MSLSQRICGALANSFVPVFFYTCYARVRSQYKIRVTDQGQIVGLDDAVRNKMSITQCSWFDLFMSMWRPAQCCFKTVDQAKPDLEMTRRAPDCPGLESSNHKLLLH